MKNQAKVVARFLTSEDGPTAVEYAIMLALIIIVCFVAIMSVGSSTNKSFSNSSLQTATVAAS
jgi:pilus assembly protein Flp/PilA